jgi:hypothetical protein
MKTLKEILLGEAAPAPQKSPMQRRREMGRRMKLLAKKSSTKLKKKRALLRKRDAASLMKSAQKQAKMTVIKKQLGPEINYNELPIQKRIQIDQKITAKKAKVIQKMTKKILRKLKAGEGERVKKAKLAQQES